MKTGDREQRAHSSAGRSISKSDGSLRSFYGKTFFAANEPRSVGVVRRGCVPENARVIFCVCKRVLSVWLLPHPQEHLRALWGEAVMSTCVVCVSSSEFVLSA